MGHKISVIIPAYNHEKYISRTIESVISQTMQDWELIIVDDGSTDNTWDIISAYARKDSRIYAITQENAGVGCASQRGLDLANGEWVCFCGSDDTLPLNALELLTADCDKYDLIIGEHERRHDSGRRTYARLPRRNQLPFLLYSSGALWAKLLRREFLISNKISFPSLLLEEDTVFLARCIAAKPKYKVVRKASYIYWDHDLDKKSLSRMITAVHFIGRAQGKQIALEILQEAGESAAYNYYSRLYAAQLLQQIGLLFDDPNREDAFSAYKLFVNSLHWSNTDFLLYVNMSKEEFANCKYSGFLFSQQSIGKPEAVEKMYQLGQIGVKYIFIYFFRWLRFKLRGE